MVTCGGQQCYVPYTPDGNTADDVRFAGAECERILSSIPEDEESGGVDLSWVGPVAVAVAVLVLLDGVRKSVHQVSQREVIVIERFGRCPLPPTPYMECVCMQNLYVKIYVDFYSYGARAAGTTRR